MKAKIIAILVIGIMALAMVVTAVGAVAQAVNAETAAPKVGQLVSRIGEDRQQTGDNTLINTFKFVCPFH